MIEGQTWAKPKPDVTWHLAAEPLGGWAVRTTDYKLRLSQVMQLRGGRSRRTSWLAGTSANRTPSSPQLNMCQVGRVLDGVKKKLYFYFAPQVGAPTVLPAMFQRVNRFRKHLSQDDDLFICCLPLPPSLRFISCLPRSLCCYFLWQGKLSSQGFFKYLLFCLAQISPS